MYRLLNLSALTDELVDFDFSPGLAQAVPRASSVLSASAKLFEFHNVFWVNLHHFLYVQARAHPALWDNFYAAVPARAAALRRTSQHSQRA